MKLVSYLHFDGDCEEAFQLYARVLGGTIQGVFHFGKSPMAGHYGQDWDSKVMHITMVAGDQTLLGCDAPAQYFRQPQGYAVCIDLPNEAEAERIYPALSEGGQIGMPLQETFWAKRYAQFVDRFGTSWMINVAKPMDM
jgi:PhnB protein